MLLYLTYLVRPNVLISLSLSSLKSTYIVLWILLAIFTPSFIPILVKNLNEFHHSDLFYIFKISNNILIILYVLIIRKQKKNYIALSLNLIIHTMGMGRMKYLEELCPLSLSTVDTWQSLLRLGRRWFSYLNHMCRYQTLIAQKIHTPGGKDKVMTRKQTLTSRSGFSGWTALPYLWTPKS